jgi:hypothetical protein
MVNKPKIDYKKNHKSRVLFEKCCRCSWNSACGDEYISMLINYNLVTVLGVVGSRDYLLNEILN